MKMKKSKSKLIPVYVRAEEHHKLKVMAAEKKITITALMSDLLLKTVGKLKQ